MLASKKLVEYSPANIVVNASFRQNYLIPCDHFDAILEATGCKIRPAHEIVLREMIEGKGMA